MNNHPYFLALERRGMTQAEHLRSKGESFPTFQQAAIAYVRTARAQLRGILANSTAKNFKRDCQQADDALEHLLLRLESGTGVEQAYQEALDLSRSVAETMDIGGVDDERVYRLMRLTVVHENAGPSFWLLAQNGKKQEA